MDSKEESLKHATKMLQGKTHRASGQPIQKTLSDKVMMDLIIKNPELMEIYQDHQMEERPYLPTQEEFVNYLREQTTIKELATKTSIKKTTIEHWFRRDDKGFSYPTIEDWKQIKPHLKTIKFDMELTTVQTKEWITKTPMLPTPTASDVEGGVAKDVQYKNGNFFRENQKGERWGVKLRDAVSILPTPTTMDHLPQRGFESMVKQTQVHRKGRTKLANLREAVNPEAVKLFNQLQNSNGNIKEIDLTQTGKNIYLNPHFVEEMMGYPIGYCV
tara:strand:- start:145 stop:963 length:819 start_codon:yes stop_codon:yes gene_type:complete